MSDFKIINSDSIFNRYAASDEQKYHINQHKKLEPSALSQLSQHTETVFNIEETPTHKNKILMLQEQINSNDYSIDYENLINQILIDNEF